MQKKYRSIFLLLSLVIVLSVGTTLFWREQFSITALLPEIILPEKHRSITLLFVGDILLDRGIFWGIHTYGKDNWKWPVLPIAKTLQEADILFGNLESQISDKGYNVGSIYSFRADPKSIQTLQYAGFDVLSVTNNHSFDYTIEAFKDSLSRLRAANIAYTGGGLSEKEAHSPIIKEVRGTNIGFLAYTNSGSASWAANENHGGIAWIDSSTLETLTQDIQNAKPQVDILVVSLHAGVEYATEPNEFQKKFAKTAIDTGADLVVGHHPHVLQPLKRYKNGWIVYSLGNFLFDQRFSEETMKGAILKIVVKNKTIKNVSLIPTTINSSFQVELVK
jgi:gamma-polyglutamate biosynthesis protein CapA